jgi:ATP-dependent exoDNAse (exonuclease V) alpha subunit
MAGVLIVDETSMLSTRDLHRLTRDVEKVGGKLLVVGDPAQIAAVDAAGGMLPALAERLDAPTLSTVHRMSQQWERDASLQLRAGDPACINTYLDHGRIHPVDAGADPHQQVLGEYQRLTADGARVLLLARTHDDVDQLNTHARAHAIGRGDVHGDPLLTAGGRDWRAGDRLRVTRNDRRIPVGADHLRNGDVFTVTGRTDQGLTVQRLDSPETAVLPHDYLAQHADYGWASTIDAAQGATVDHSLVLARPGLHRTRLYVGMTRDRQTNQLYLAPEPDPEIAPRDWQRRPVDPGDQLARMLLTAGEQAAAHTRLPDTLILPSRVPPESVQATTEPARRPSRGPDPSDHPQRRDEPYRGFAR